jgi:hypothetical protein
MKTDETKVLDRIERLLARIAAKLGVEEPAKPKSAADVVVVRRVFGNTGA